MNEEIKAHWEKFYGMKVELGPTKEWYYVRPADNLRITLVAYKMSYLRFLDSKRVKFRSEQEHLVSLPDDTWVYPFTVPNSPLTEEMMLRMLRLKAFL